MSCGTKLDLWRSLAVLSWLSRQQYAFDPFLGAHSQHACVWYGMAVKHITAVGLLTERDLKVLGPMLNKAWPVEDAPSFSELLRAIDDADEAHRRTCEKA